MNEEHYVDYRFKILYAIGIIMVVAGHCGGGGISLISDWFPYGGLHLALFVFCSGYFYKSSAESNIPKYIIKKICRLVVPLYLYTLVYGLVVSLLKLKGFEMGADLSLTNLIIMPITNGHQYIYNMGGWFIAPLFMVEMYNVLFRKGIKLIKSDMSEWFFFAVNIILGILGNNLACKGYLANWWLVLVRMLYFVPFYGLGIIYKTKLENYEKRISSFWYFMTIFFIRLVIICYYGKQLAYTPSWCNNFTEGPIMPVIIGFIGIALWMRIATILEPVIGKSKWINLIANNTYSIMMNQFLGFMIVKTIFAFMNKYLSLFLDFDWVRYKRDIWYYYIPKGVGHTLIIYLIAGIIVPIGIQKMIDWIKKYFSINKRKAG